MPNETDTCQRPIRGVFNIAHNRYRLIAAMHYNTLIVYTLMILTHKEYDRDAWKEQF